MPKIVDHDAYRAELLERCLDLFASRGYAGLTMRALAKALGISTGTLYHYFPTKQAMFEQMFRHLSERDIVSGFAEIQRRPAGRARVEALFAFVARNEQHFSRLIAVALDYQRQQPAGSARTLIAATLRAYRTSICASVDVDEPVAAFLLSTILGACVQRMIAPRTASLKAQGRLAAELVPIAAAGQSRDL